MDGSVKTESIDSMHTTDGLAYTIDFVSSEPNTMGGTVSLPHYTPITTSLPHYTPITIAPEWMESCQVPYANLTKNLTNPRVTKVVHSFDPIAIDVTFTSAEGVECRCVFSGKDMGETILKFAEHIAGIVGAQVTLMASKEESTGKVALSESDIDAIIAEVKRAKR